MSTARAQPPASPDPRARRRALARDVGVNAALPYAIYLLLRQWSVDVVPALAIGAVIPAASVILGALLRHRVEAIGLVVLAASGAGIMGGLRFTSPFLLLAKGSFITGAVGTLFLASLLARRPLIFYAVAATGQDEAARTRYDALWDQKPEFRRLMRWMTLIWGVALYAEACLRLLLIGLLPIAVFLPVSEAMWMGFFVLMTAWSWRYGRKRMERLRAA
jgi:hypothetical protein